MRFCLQKPVYRTGTDSSTTQAHSSQLVAMRYLWNAWSLLIIALTSLTTASLLFTGSSSLQPYRITTSKATTNGPRFDMSLWNSNHNPQPPNHHHWDLYPKSYTVYRIPPQYQSLSSDYDDDSPQQPAFPIDGNLDKDIWKNVPWSDSFGDIQGKDEPEPKHTIPLTRFKALYDDSFVYIAATLHPADGITTEAHFTQRNSPIYQRDSDFEVFIDVDHSNHMYKELEVNAINTVWNLLLDKPYDDGGVEHSGRIATRGEDLYYDVSRQHTATRIVDGTLNNETSHTGAWWSVEMALSYSDLLANTTLRQVRRYSPQNTFWRVNFSRVEQQGKINWTWQPQNRWNPEMRQFQGYVQMHLPETWGYFYFSDEYIDTSVEPSPAPRDPVWPLTLTAMTIYYALHYYKSQHGQYTDHLSELSLPVDLIAPFDCDIQRIRQNDTTHDEGFLVHVVHKWNHGQNSRVQVRDDRFLQMFPFPTTTSDA